MLTKIVKNLKYSIVLLFVFSALLSCKEEQIENIGVDLIDNNTFSTNSKTFSVTTAQATKDKVQSNNQSQYLLGSYNDSNFGELTASFVTQLNIPSVGTTYQDSFDKDAEIDSVIVYIPYQATRQEDDSDGKPVFEIDSIFGNSDVAFKLEVYELETFLNTLDPEDPSKAAIYYSDKDFLKGDLLSDTSIQNWEKFKVNPNDTVAYINRFLADGITIYDKDTIKADNLNPSIKLSLNKDIIKQKLVDNAGSSDFTTLDDFQHYFRGLYFEATSLGESSHLVSLNLTSANMTVYYSITEDEDEEQDLDGDGTKGENDVRTKHSHIFTFSTIKSNIYKRENSSIDREENRIYIQGAAGEDAAITLNFEDELDNLKTSNLLITEANLTFYIDQDKSVEDIIPQQLYLYNFDENSQIIDILTEGAATVGGALEYDEDGNPEKYIFRITDYISKLLNEDDEDGEYTSPITFGLKVYNPSDIPTSASNLSIPNFSWTPKGVVLHGPNSEITDKKLQLEINYTELNE